MDPYFYTVVAGGLVHSLFLLVGFTAAQQLLLQLYASMVEVRDRSPAALAAERAAPSALTA